MKKQKIFFGNKVEYNKITVNESRDGVFPEETIRVDVIKEKKDDVLFDIEDKSKEITDDKTIIVRTLENEGKKYKNETLENSEKKFKEEYDENEENNEINKEDLDKHIQEKENKNEINTVYQIENIIDGVESEVPQNTGVFDVAELNEKLEKENEIKFDEMYQKAFGTEVSEKRKERLKNEEKIDRKFYSKTSKK